MERALNSTRNHKASLPTSPICVPVVKRIKGRLNLRQLNASNPQDYPFLLQSTALSEADNSTATSYDILFSFPEQTIQLTSEQKLYRYGEYVSAHNDFFVELDSQWQDFNKKYLTDISLPFSGGWFLYLGYELAQQVEPRLKLSMPEDGFPIACAIRIPAAVIYDYANNETILVAEGDKSELLDKLETDLNNNTEKESAKDESFSVVLNEDNEQAYLDNVEKVKKYITDGDVFQVNLSRSWKGAKPHKLKSAHVYQRLSQTNPAPFSGIMDFPFGSIISSSPERLLKIKQGWAETRPIAGTRPRNQQHVNDKADKDELITHPKERAEHIMLVDLERNDLGRVCKPGSVRVDEMMVMESYAHVHHIVSNVKGELRKDITPGEAIRAVFPGGTITGCPKERCMAIISELEQEPRGAYTGSVGYLNHNGDMDINILIRTITMTQDEIRLRTGAGLVFDSIAENELEETRHKAKGLLLALGVINE